MQETRLYFELQNLHFKFHSRAPSKCLSLSKVRTNSLCVKQNSWSIYFKARVWTEVAINYLHVTRTSRTVKSLVCANLIHEAKEKNLKVKGLVCMLTKILCIPGRPLRWGIQNFMIASAWGSTSVWFTLNSLQDGQANELHQLLAWQWIRGHYCINYADN